MTEYATSADGTRIAFDLEGEGPAVVLVAGAIQFRGFDPTTVELAHQLAAKGFTVVNYDRRGRGESPASSFGLQRDIEDIAAMVEVVGGSAALFGSSSGGAIVLAAAAAGLPVTRLALWEVPLGTELGGDGAEFLAGLRERLAAGDGNAAMEYYMKDMPPQWLAGAKQGPGWPIMTALTPSLEGDAEALAWAQSAPRKGLWAGITQPVVAIVGEQTLPIMTSASASIVGNLAHAEALTIPGENHGWEPAVMAGVLAGFLTD
jgi:pimeloyl-ACP methyl ester carboxylesterase